MKLLYCRICEDVFRLRYVPRKCLCGHTSGRYVDSQRAEYSGLMATPVGFANSSFEDAFENRPESGQGKVFEAFVIPKQCDTFVKVDDG